MSSQTEKVRWTKKGKVRPTFRQIKLAEAIIENSAKEKPETKQAVLEKVGYSPVTARSSAAVVLEHEGVKVALEERGFNVDNAKRVVAKILDSDDEKAADRLRAAEQIFQVHGAYAPTKTQSVSVNLDAKDFEKYAAISSKFDDEMLKHIEGETV